jgi:hypothetical protein
MLEPIKVEGLQRFTRGLKNLDANAPKAVRLGLNEAVNVVVSYARPLVPKQSGRAARSIKAKSTRTAARIGAGGSRAPYFPWLDFGGKTGRNRSVDRPFYKEGRYLWKGYVVKRDELTASLTRTLNDVAEQAGLDVT